MHISNFIVVFKEYLNENRARISVNLTVKWWRDSLKTSVIDLRVSESDLMINKVMSTFMN